MELEYLDSEKSDEKHPEKLNESENSDSDNCHLGSGIEKPEGKSSFVRNPEGNNADTIQFPKESYPDLHVTDEVNNPRTKYSGFGKYANPKNKKIECRIPDNYSSEASNENPEQIDSEPDDDSSFSEGDEVIKNLEHITLLLITFNYRNT